jgi:hypothetical protein
MRTFKTVFFVIIAVSMVLTGSALAQDKVKYSGFLGDYPSFEQDADRKGAMVYRKAGVDLKPYTKIMIDPIEIWVADDSKYKGIKPDDVKILADTFRQAFVDALEPVYPVVDKPGPDVLGLRLAITNVYMTKKKRGLLGYTPVGLVVSTAAKAIGENMSLQGAVIEAELLDSQTNERLGAIMDQQPKTDKEKSSFGKLSAVQKGATSWVEIEDALKFYAKRFRSRMDEVHGK